MSDVVVKPILKIPAKYICSITGQIMMDPVVAADGRTYEREAIEQWLTTNNISPITGALLPNTNLITNWDKKSDIEEFLGKHPELCNIQDLYLSKAWQHELVDAIKTNNITNVNALLNKDKRLLTSKLIDDYTAFHLACEFGSPDINSIILRKLQQTKQLDVISKQPAEFKPTQNPVFLALLNQLQPTLVFLIGDKLATLPPLHVALELNDNELLNNLLTNKIGSLDAINEQQYPALHVAVIKGNSDAVKLILAAGVNLFVSAGPEKITPLHIVAHQEDTIIAELLLARPEVAMTINSQNIYGDAAIHIAASIGRNNIIPLLLQNGADHKLKNLTNQTPIELALQKNQMETAKLIEQTARSIKLFARAEVFRLRQLTSEQASRIEQLQREREENTIEINKQASLLSDITERVHEVNIQASTVFDALKTHTHKYSTVWNGAIPGQFPLFYGKVIMPGYTEEPQLTTSSISSAKMK